MLRSLARSPRAPLAGSEREPSAAERLAPRRRPRLLPAGFQEWRRLLFVHWRVPPEALRPLVPPGLSLDLFDGAAYVSLTPFVVEAARPFGAPRRLGLAFLETNVRTYVHVQGREPGVYFLSLDAASWLAVLGARLSLGLPYLYARSHERRSAAGVDYRLQRCAPGAPGCHVRYQPGEVLGSAEPGTLDFFLVERYLLHVQRGPSLWTVQVHHRPYPLQRARVDALKETLLQADGLAQPTGAPLAHFSPGVDVAIFPPRVRLA
jgi:uncharacterized protein YqjF (DUF2071 family)